MNLSLSIETTCCCSYYTEQHFQEPDDTTKGREGSRYTRHGQIEIDQYGRIQDISEDTLRYISLHHIDTICGQRRCCRAYTDHAIVDRYDRIRILDNLNGNYLTNCSWKRVAKSALAFFTAATLGLTPFTLSVSLNIKNDTEAALVLTSLFIGIASTITAFLYSAHQCARPLPRPTEDWKPLFGHVQLALTQQDKRYEEVPELKGYLPLEEPLLPHPKWRPFYMPKSVERKIIEYLDPLSQFTCSRTCITWAIHPAFRLGQDSIARKRETKEKETIESKREG